MTERLFVVGPGRLGLALGHALWQADALEALTYAGRRPDPPSHPLFTQGIARYVFGLERPEPDTTAVILAVPDRVLPEMAVAMAGQGDAPPGAAAFHLSGVLSTDPLTPLHRRGYSVGSLHPLQAIVHPVTGADRLPGSYFAVTGEPEAMATARRLLSYLGSHYVEVPAGNRPLYHAAAVLASNGLVGLLGAAARLLVRAGVPPADAERALLPLARGTLENLVEYGIPEALTGPVARGDLDTLDLHLRSLEPAERELYAVLGTEIVELAARAGLDPPVAEEMSRRLGEVLGGAGGGSDAEMDEREATLVSERDGEER